MEQIKIQKLNNRLSSLNIRVEKLNSADDLHAEELLQAGAGTPIGQLLEKISNLPEVRLEKISTVRRQICMGKYEIDEKLDAAVDRILEELIIES
ncbi:MAG: flagellar biosynthesis anti-sigma factor FlgM [Phycisphaerae bacterium]|jgi:anti-sigma28 factor (negative regulator of flagellin synthesis)